MSNAYGQFLNSTYGSINRDDWVPYSIPEGTPNPNVPPTFPTIFVQSYNCAALEPRGVVSILIALLVGCYALLMAGYKTAMYLLVWYYGPRTPGAALN
jgi:hypothetical protein